MPRRLVRCGDGAVVADPLEVAASFWTRLVGLMGRRELPGAAGLWLEPCDSVHMMFMRFPVDVVFLAREGVVLKVCPARRPWLGVAWCRGARGAVELPAGRAAAVGLQPGDRLAQEATARAVHPPRGEAVKEPG